jgi:VCBS repeat-containing protein
MITFRIGDVALNMGASDFESFVLDQDAVSSETLDANLLNLVGSMGSLFPPDLLDSDHWIFSSDAGQELHFYGEGMSLTNAPVSELVVTDNEGVEIFGFELSEPMVLNAIEMSSWDQTQVLDFFTGVFDGQAITVHDGVRGNTINGSALADVINGNGGHDRLGGLGGADVIDGGIGNDTLNGGSGADSLLGGAGNDVFSDQSGNDTLNGGAGNDVFRGQYSAGASVKATGGTGSDTFAAGAGAGFVVTDFTIGGAERDRIDAGALIEASARAGYYAGQDLLAGGFIRQVQSGASKLVQWDLDGVGSAHNGVTFMTLSGRGSVALTSQNFAGIIPGTAGANNLAGGASDDILLGLGGNDSLSGGAGDDLLFGGTGADTLRGGTGSDTYHVDNAGDRVLEEGAGADTVISTVNYTAGQLVENVVLAGAAARATGNNLANALTGNAGADSLTGGGGGDTLKGGAGNDTLDGGAGNDWLSGDEGADVLRGGLGNDTYVAGDSISDTGGIDTVRSSLASHTLGSGLENLVLFGAGVNGTGNNLANSITGNTGGNNLSGAGGNDVLVGGAGADTLSGGGGDDTLHWDPSDALVDGGANNDTLVLGGSILFVLSDFAGSVIQEIEVIQLAGNEAVVLDATAVAAINGADLLTINGDGGDTVTATDAWVFDSSGGGYNFYTSGDLTLKISSAIVFEDMNDAPAITGPAAPPPILEDASDFPSVNGEITFSDPDLDDPHSVFGAADEANALGGSFGGFISSEPAGSEDGVLAWNYMIDSSLIQSLAEGATATESYTYTIQDGEGAFVGTTVTVTITGVNDAPENTVADDHVAGLEDFNIGGVAVTDVDVGDVLEITLSTDLGLLTLDITGLTLTFTSGDGDQDASMVFEGSVDDVNAALGTLFYHATEAGSGLITLSSSDGLLTDTDSFGVLINS